MASKYLNRPTPKFPLLPTLTASIGVLVLIAVGSVMATNWISDRIILQELASRLVNRVLGAEDMALRRELNEATRQADFIAEAIKDKRYQFADPNLGDFLSGTIAAASEVDGLFLSDPHGSGWRVLRGAADKTYQLDHVDISGNRELTEIADEISRHKDPYWGPPVYGESRQATYLNYRVPIWRDNTYLGYVAIGISTRSLSMLARQMSEPPRSVAFMLYGNDRVLAHTLMTEGTAGRSKANPLPPLAAFGDPVIANFYKLPPLHTIFLKPIAGILVREPVVDGERYIVVARQISDYGEMPITVGAYFLRRAIDAPVLVLYRATLIAIALLGLSLIAAALMARAIVRPISRAAKGAAAISNLDFDQVAPLSGGVFREIHNLAQAFNTMLDGLKAFGRYVPRTLVARLVKEGRIGAGIEERVLAIMFTDIVSFTTACEKMSATEVAEFINQHLALVSACVEQEGGTIDKFIGDAVMAFWGAPGRADNPAASACLAATAIQRELAADNQRRAAKGLDPVRIRIGIHMGPVVVGDIGSPNRINYTIVGDAVNATQRLESLGKTIDPNAESIALVSKEIFDALPSGFRLEPQGTHLVKGKLEGLEVYRLVGGPEGR